MTILAPWARSLAWLPESENVANVDICISLSKETFIHSVVGNHLLLFTHDILFVSFSYVQLLKVYQKSQG